MLPFSEAPPDINSLYIEPINHTQLNTFIISFNTCLTSCLCALFWLFGKALFCPTVFGVMGCGQPKKRPRMMAVSCCNFCYALEFSNSQQ